MQFLVSGSQMINSYHRKINSQTFVAPCVHSYQLCDFW